MSNSEIFDKCLEMQVESNQDFVLDHDPARGEMPALVVLLSQARSGVAYSISRNGREINVRCYYILKEP